MFVLWAVASLLLLWSAVALLWRWRDARARRRERARLLGFQPVAPARFEPSMVDDLPEAARRYFRFAITPGTLLHRVVDITMVGVFSLGERDAPQPMAMRATQRLAAPYGFIWAMRAGRGLQRLAGSDSTWWTRFWLLGLIPVARLGGDDDHRRAAFGRFVAEAMFWSPASLLPGPGVRWEALDARSARVHISHDGLSQAVDLHIDDSGRPTHVCFMRWSNANPQKRFQLQPFGGYLSAFECFAGFTLPTHVEAGNFFGTDDYFAFYVIDVTAIGFPGARMA